MDENEDLIFPNSSSFESVFKELILSLHFCKAIFEQCNFDNFRKYLLGQNFTYFYICNFKEVCIFVTSNPIVGYNNMMKHLKNVSWQRGA